MSIYSNDIRKIAKLTTRELPHLVQKRENNYAKIMAYTVYWHDGLVVKASASQSGGHRFETHPGHTKDS